MYWIIFVAVILVIIAIALSNKYESFSPSTYDNYNFYNVSSVTDPRWQGSLSQDCTTEKLGNCLNYSNCGICLNQGKCVFGDEEGPLFNGNCNGWLYSNYRDRKIFNEKVTRIVPSWDTFYPDYEATYPSPVSWAAL